MSSQKFSRYLPVNDVETTKTSRAGSHAKDGDSKARDSKSSRLTTSLQNAKRRSTMNSRDAAYDEEEQIRRAIEASKGEDKNSRSIDGGTRRTKRGRSDSEE